VAAVLDHGLGVTEPYRIDGVPTSVAGCSVGIVLGIRKSPLGGLGHVGWKGCAGFCRINPEDFAVEELLVLRHIVGVALAAAIADRNVEQFCRRIEHKRISSVI